MIILGINAYHPDSSACIIRDGALLAAAEEERFCRIKHWSGFPAKAIEFCLKEAGVNIENVDHIAYNRDPKANIHKKILFTLAHRPPLALIANRTANLFKLQHTRALMSKGFAAQDTRIRAKIHMVEHHRAHMASVFFVSPFDTSTIVTIDGFGDFSSCMVARGGNRGIETHYEINFPHSLGILYTAITQFLGFKKFGDEYKVMGLAAYGKPSLTSEFEDVISTKPRGMFELNLRYFSFHKNSATMEWDNTEPKLPDVYSAKFIEKFGKPRDREEKISQLHCDLAASAQAVYEKVFFHILNHAFSITGDRNLCLAGGCALNSVANGKIFDHTPFKEIYIQPASSDAGGALGAAYYLYHQLLGHQRCFVMRNAYWGPHFDDHEIRACIESNNEALKDCRIEQIEDREMLCKKAAQHIAQGDIIGWFQARMEWGPRALGNRSIVVDPRRPDMKDILNERIKRREWFRPFAPSILLEKVGEYFEKDYPDPFMLKVYPIKKEKQALIPAVVHVDGTGRLQTVSKIENPLYWQLIHEFQNLTGVPIVLNTSFNENEPIVCTPQQALDCFLRTRMHVLVLNTFVISRK